MGKKSWFLLGGWKAYTVHAGFFIHSITLKNLCQWYCIVFYSKRIKTAHTLTQKRNLKKKMKCGWYLLNHTVQNMMYMSRFCDLYTHSGFWSVFESSRNFKVWFFSCMFQYFENYEKKNKWKQTWTNTNKETLGLRQNVLFLPYSYSCHCSTCSEPT